MRKRDKYVFLCFSCFFLLKIFLRTQRLSDKERFQTKEIVTGFQISASQALFRLFCWYKAKRGRLVMLSDHGFVTQSKYKSSQNTNITNMNIEVVSLCCHLSNGGFVRYKIKIQTEVQIQIPKVDQFCLVVLSKDGFVLYRIR